MSEKNNSVISEPKFALEDILTRSRKTLKQISEESGIGLKTIYELRSRKYKHGPRLSVLEALAPVLGVEPERLRDAVAGKDCARAQRARQDEKDSKAEARAAKRDHPGADEPTANGDEDSAVPAETANEVAD